MSSATSPLAPQKPSRDLSLGCAIPFGLVFATAGLLAFWFTSVRPYFDAQASTTWVQTPCEILTSKLTSHRGDDSTTYRVAITYRYVWQGRTYEGDRYDFSTGSTNIGVTRMREAIAAFPPGRRTVCFVDPAAPDSAVLNQSTPNAVWFGFLTLLFPLFGFGLIIAVWRGKRGKAAAASPLSSGRVPSPSDPTVRAGGEIALKPNTGRIAAFIGLGFFALFWNGIVSVFVYHAVSDFGRGGFFGWFLPIFLIPFLVIGLFVLAATVHAFSRLFAPPVELRLDPSLLRLGAEVPFRWRLGGSGVRRLTIKLVAREEATYQQGTRTATDRSDYHRSVLVDSTDRLSLTEGRGKIPLPSVAPTFAATNNRLVWEISFQGEIPWRADVNDTFTLEVQGPDSVAAPAIPPDPKPFPGGGLTLWTVDRFRPGETLFFTVTRDPSPTTANPTDPLTVQLGWFTEGKGTRDAAVVWTDTIASLPSGADRSFEVKLPSAPWSFSGRLIALAWRLEVLDATGAPLVATPLTIGPGGEPAHLESLPPDSALSKWKSLFGQKK